MCYVPFTNHGYTRYRAMQGPCNLVGQMYYYFGGARGREIRLVYLADFP